MEEQRVALTDTEWMSLISKERDGLPACCTSVSNLRDQITQLAREDGVLNITIALMLAEAYEDFDGSHEKLPLVEKLMDQVRSFLAEESTR